MRIGELAGQSGASVQTLRFYERTGLLPKPSRTEAGYRVYAPGDLRRVEMIRQAKRLGFSLDEIKRILRLRQQGSSPCGEAITILDKHLRETEEQIRDLQRFRKEIARTLQDWKRSGAKAIRSDAICGLIERTIPKQSITKKEKTMALQKGEVYRCPDSECGCEITVTKGAAPGKGGSQHPRCCCGKEMKKQS